MRLTGKGRGEKNKFHVATDGKDGGVSREHARYLHGEVVNEANPSARVFEEHVDFLLERFALSLVEHVLGLERLIDGQVNRVVRVRDAGRRGRFRVADGDRLDDGRRVVRVAARRRQVREVFAWLPALLQRRRHAPMMRFAESRHPPVMVRRPDLLVFFRFITAAAAVKLLLSTSPVQQLIVVTATLLFGGSERRRRRNPARQPRSLPLLQFVQQHIVAVAVVAAAATAAATSYAVATAVASQRHFPGLAKQLYLFGAVHVDAKRPRQHPAAAAVRMAPCARTVAVRSQRIRRLLCRVPPDTTTVLQPVALAAVPVAVVVTSVVTTVPVVSVATAKPSEYGHRWTAGSRIR